MACAPDPADDPCFAGTGEMAARMRAFPWSQSPLGPPRGWPQPLRSLMPILLESHFAMRILWGPEMLLLYNDAYRRVLGPQKHPGALGRPMIESYREVWSTVGPMFARVMQGEAVSLDDGLLALDRNGLVEESFFTLSYSPIRDEEGQVRGVLGVVHETTERVLAERRLSILRALAANLADVTSVEAACVTAGETLVRHGADVAFALFYAADAEHREARLVSQCGLGDHPDAAPQRIRLDDDGAPWPLARAAAGRGAKTIDDVAARVGELHAGRFPEPISRAILLPLVRPGTALPLLFVVAGLNPRRALDEQYQAFFELLAEHVAKACFNVLARNEEREHAEALAQAARGATAAAEAERQRVERLNEDLARQKTALENADRLKDEFVSVMSHELRTPLNAVLGWTRMLKMGSVSPARVPHALEIIERNAAAQTALINDLLDVSRILTGKLRLNVEPIDLPALLQAAIETLRPAAEAKCIQIHPVLASDAGPVMGDADRLSQIFSNLLSNAVKFTPKGGRVQVTLSRADALVQLTVQDSGAGMPAELLPFIFERFRQGDQTITRQHGGLGLGLSIAKHLVELHGGTIAAESPGLGQGSSFTVTIPLHAVIPATTTTRDPAGRAPGAHLTGLRALVVDDEPDAREMLAEVLSGAGGEARTAEGSEAALRELTRFVPHVVICDVGMPSEDGYSLMQRIRALPAEQGGGVLAVAVTAYARGEDRRRALAAGFNLHFAKPVDPGELVMSIARLSGRCPA